MPLDELDEILKRHFGFDAFRPLQRPIIQDVLAGRDVFALLPTGGGKSLCYQLPAVVNDGLTVVVSPLIALMKDQVDALQANGISATFINSSLSADEARARWRGLHDRRYRLLYVAPERLMLAGFLANLEGWKIDLIAIDEAHCISEWGHDFRPEYRELALLRDRVPGTPILALTATATDRVRADIVGSLRLNDPRCYAASFNRPNLTYRVLPKQKPRDQVLEFVRSRPAEGGIVYCHSRKGAEDLAEHLRRAGVAALPYHAGLDGAVRAAHQEAFLKDDAQVICATIAFGMGINKSNVRYVIHHDLPRNLEGYYQETGRAGRDGLPGECLLLFTPADVRKQLRFIEEKPDAHAQDLARRQLRQMVDYAEVVECRRAHLLRYFGETYSGPCGACDNCLTPRETFDGTVTAQKFLSCVYRIRAKSGFGVGLRHIADVLRGAGHEKILRWGHDQLSTYGIGKEHTRDAWQAFGRELIRLGLLDQPDGPMSGLELTEAGLAVLKDRRPVALTRPPTSIRADKVRESAPTPDSRRDDPLFDRLRRLRKRLADEQNVPAYIVFSDATLREMAQRRPTTLSEFAQLTGVGDRKLRAYGTVFLQEIVSAEPEAMRCPPDIRAVSSE